MIKGYKFGENKFGIKVSNNRGKTHWHECWRVHHECALAKILELYELLHKIEMELPEDSPFIDKIIASYPTLNDN